MSCRHTNEGLVGLVMPAGSSKLNCLLSQCLSSTSVIWTPISTLTYANIRPYLISLIKKKKSANIFFKVEKKSKPLIQPESSNASGTRNTEEIYVSSDKKRLLESRSLILSINVPLLQDMNERRKCRSAISSGIGIYMREVFLQFSF